MKKEKIWIKSKNGNKLSCLVAKPEGKIKGMVVSSQGFESTKNKPTYQFLLDELPKIGFNVIVFEYQGLGESEGKIKEKTVTRDMEDLRAVIDFAYNSFEFNKEKFFVFGPSFGGFTALNMALEDKRIKGLVLKCPVSDFNQTCPRPKIEKKSFLDCDSFLEDGNKYDLYSKISNIHIPIKIIHGDKDKSVSIEQSKKIENLLPNAELKIMEGEGHHFENKQKEVNAQIIKFFEEL